jgi:uroporphyrinogen-III synthase
MSLESLGKPPANAAAPRSCHSPLAGRRIALTWPVEQGWKLISQLEAAGARVTPLLVGVVIPFPDTTALDSALRNARRYDAIALTSLVGVNMLARRLAALGLGRGAWRRLIVAPVDSVGEINGKRLLLLRAERPDGAPRDPLARALRGGGALVDEVTAYRLVAHPVSVSALQSALAHDPIDAIVCTDAVMVDGLLMGVRALGLQPSRALRNKPLIALDAGAEARLRSAGLVATIAPPLQDIGATTQVTLGIDVSSVQEGEPLE